MTSRVEAFINPGVLTWARERLGQDLATAARQLAVKEDRLAAWESGEQRPTVNQLYKLAEKYGQAPAVFYLLEPPSDEALPHDFRHVSEAPSQVNSDLVREIRRVQRLRVEALDLLEDLEERTLSFHVSAELADDSEEVAERLRKVLGVGLEDQFRWKDSAVARKVWTDAIEQLGILVFSAERISTHVFRGVSISGDGIPAIQLNGQDSDAGRVFTLMHELSHIALHNAGICNPFDQPAKAKTLDAKTEWFCNRVAASLLIPRKSLLKEPDVARATPSTEWPDDVLSHLAQRYSVSREAMLVRLLELGKTNQEYYDAKRRDFQREYERYRARKAEKPAFVPYKYRVLNRNGRAYTKLVLSALHEDLITTADVASLTGVNLKHMGSVEEELFGRTIIFGHGA
ncbi:MAG: ImmA/IrrE family metallo-endopeptidase [Chromatiales bacterium]